MAFPTNAAPNVVIKTSRETLALVIAASAMTFAISYVVHSRPDRNTPPAEVSHQEWTGHLAELDTSPTATVSAERLSSDTLVVPKDQLALPTMNLRPLAKLRGCDGSSCVMKAVVPTPPAKHETVAVRQVTRERQEEVAAKRPGLLSRLNPLDRISSVIRKPFSYAGDKVAGWFNNF